MTVKVKGPQWRMYEIGLIGRIAHNLAKYRCNISNAYTPEEFIDAVRIFMEERQVEIKQIEQWLIAAESQSDEDIEFFITRGEFAESHGGSSLTVEALIGDVLEELGY